MPLIYQIILSASLLGVVLIIIIINAICIFKILNQLLHKIIKQTVIKIHSSEQNSKIAIKNNDNDQDKQKSIIKNTKLKTIYKKVYKPDKYKR